MTHIHRVQAETQQRRRLVHAQLALADQPRQPATPGAARTPDQPWRGERRKVRQAVEPLRIAGIAQTAAPQGLSGASAHQPGRRDETMQRPALPGEQLHALLQPSACLGFGQRVELPFIGVDAAHEPVARRARCRRVVGMVVAVQHQLVAARQALTEQVEEPRVR
ncbi:hypothetical protein D3C77_537630 [compost metagenome]